MTDRELSTVPASSVRVVKMEAAVGQANRAAINQLEGASTDAPAAAGRSISEVPFKEHDRATFSKETRAQMWQHIAQ